MAGFPLISVNVLVYWRPALFSPPGFLCKFHCFTSWKVGKCWTSHWGIAILRVVRGQNVASLWSCNRKKPLSCGFVKVIPYINL